MDFIYILIILILLVCLVIKKKQTTQNNEQQEQELRLRNAELINNYNQQLAAERAKLDDELTARRKNIAQDLAQYESQEKTRINSNLDDFKKQLEQNKIATEQAYDLLYAENINVFQQGLEYYNNRAQEIIQELKDEYNENKDLLDDFKAKRDAINQEIMRQRELEEQQDFYRIQLTQSDIDDIQILNSIRSRLNKITILDKLIYDMYVSKPVNEMIKRVLKGEAPSGIYKITRLKTGEIYIGKSTDIKSRWQQHAKSAFHCGTISHSILHTTMERDGINNFTFELVEEVSKEKLTEREKFWISFYDSTKYGLNERLG